MAADGAGERRRGADPGCTVDGRVRPAASYDGEPCEGDVGEHAVLQGRGQKRCPLSNRHVFCATFSNVEGPPVPIPDTATLPFFTQKERDPRTYTIKTAGYDLFRQGSDLLPLLQSELQLPPPAGVGVSLKSALKLRINLWDDSDRQPILIDWGQEVEVLCERIALHIVGPLGMIFVPADNGRHEFDNDDANLRSGVVIDSVLNASIWATEAPRGDEMTRANLTTIVAVTANTQPLVPVPTNAIALTGYQSAIGAASVAWNMIASGSQIVGTFPWLARKTIDDEVPLTNISHVSPEIDPVNSRIFTIRWKIQL